MANGLGHHIWNVPVAEIHRFAKVIKRTELNALTETYG